jgi:hypothetical protein
MKELLGASQILKGSTGSRSLILRDELGHRIERAIGYQETCRDNKNMLPTTQARRRHNLPKRCYHHDS